MGELEIDMLVDVRDTDYVWSIGKVTMIIEQMGKEALYVIHFEGKPSSEDEIIYRNSDRLAKHGTFTNRLDIPQWHSQKSEDGSKVSVLRNQILSTYDLFDEPKISREPHSLAPVTQESDQNPSDQIGQQINTFLGSYEESSIDQQRLQRWANQQNQ